MHSNKDKENIISKNNQAALKPKTRTGFINPSTKILPVLASKSSTQKISSETAPKLVKSASVNGDLNGKNLTAIGHRQFEYAEIQKKRKEQLIQKMKDQEQKELKYQFHAKAAPKFKKVVAQYQRSVEERRMVVQRSLSQMSLHDKGSKENPVPSCGDPEKLKYLNEKKKMLVAKYQETQVHFKAKPATVLKKQPFQPVYNNLKVVDPKPFKLHLTARLIQRSEFNKKLNEATTMRKKQEEILLRQKDLDDRKLIRQKTEFRANPIHNKKLNH